MEKLISELYKITALTNLHVGSGDQNYGVVDKLVQRDSLTNFPIIHASSLKGALKKYCEAQQGDTDKINAAIKDSFGDENNPGQDKYFSAHLLTIPVRSNHKPYFRATCPTILKELMEFLATLGFSSDSAIMKNLKILCDIPFTGNTQFILFHDVVDNCLIEEYLLKDNYETKPDKFIDCIETILNWIKNEFILIRDDIFSEICENLPVVARNRLDNKRNLWYEELVQRQSEFYFFFLGTKTGSDNIMDMIVKQSKNSMPVQIGANASVGYGYCKINKIIVS